MDQGHILIAGFGVMLVGFAGASLLLGGNDLNLKFFHVGLYTPIVIVLYLVAMRAAFVYERRRPAPKPIVDKDPEVTLAMVVTRHLAAAAVVVGAGTGCRSSASRSQMSWAGGLRLSERSLSLAQPRCPRWL